jgi:inorganic pyrophosphatase
MEETLEEAAERLYPDRLTFMEQYRKIEQMSFIEGAKWQEKRMFSEEEVKQIIDATLIEYSDFVLADIPEWFEQFKNDKK